MKNLSAAGRCFYGIAIAGIGFLTIFYHDFSYMMIPPDHSWIPGLFFIADIFGALLILTGACIVSGKMIRPVALLTSIVLLAIFCFYHVPYQLMTPSRYMHFGNWENAEKELTLCAGALIVAGVSSGKNKIAITRFFTRLTLIGIILFSLTITCYGISHFVYINAVIEYMPPWVTHPMFWGYLAGIGLLGSGVAILLNIKRKLMAILLGAMILTWFIILHIPKVIAAPVTDEGGEATSAFLALAYSGIAFVISGIS